MLRGILERLGGRGREVPPEGEKKGGPYIISAEETYYHLETEILALAQELRTEETHKSATNEDPKAIHAINGCAFYLGTSPESFSDSPRTPSEMNITHIVTFDSEDQTNLLISLLHGLREIRLVPRVVILDQDIYEDGGHVTQEIFEATRDTERLMLATATNPTITMRS